MWTNNRISFYDPNAQHKILAEIVTYLESIVLELQNNMAIIQHFFHFI